MSVLIPFPSNSYRAKLLQVSASGLHFKIAGTLDGYVDLAITEAGGKSFTYSLTCEDAEALAAAINAVVNDVRQNCLYEDDALLDKKESK